MKIIKLFVLSGLLITFLSFSSFGQKLKAEEILAKHLDSIGKSELRSPEKSRLAVGDATVTFVSQKNQNALGRIVLASVGAKNFWGLNLNAADYPSEKFSFDGKKAKVGFVRIGERSVLGKFVLSNSQLLEESLLGGTLSSSWALLNFSDKKAKISSDGKKKIDDKEVYAIGYTPKNSDIDITLYFDKDTFRHVRTEYRRMSSAGIGTTPDQSSQFSETRYKVTENFSDYRDEKGLMLPHDYQIIYSITGQNGTTEIKWNFKLNQFAFDQTLDEKTFDAEAN